MTDSIASMDPRVMKQLLMAQFLSGSGLLGGTDDASAADGSQGGGLFGQLLEQLLNPAGGTDALGLAGGDLGLTAGLGLNDTALNGLGLNGLGLNGLGLNGLGLDASALNGLGSLGGSTLGETGADGSGLTALLMQAMGMGSAGLDESGLGGSGLSYSAASSDSETAYDGLIQAAASRYGVDPALVKSVIQSESSFRPDAVSSAGAKGLMQLMDGTARGLGVTDSFDPAQNIDAGTRYLSYLLRKYDGQTATALAAYNAGPGTIDGLGLGSDADIARRFRELPQETQNYVRKTMNVWQAWSAAV